MLKRPLSLAAAESLAARTPGYNALLRTTCTPTMLAAGHAENALPALATATVNCRLIPGEYSADIMRMLKAIVADTAVMIAEVNPAKPSPPSPLLPERMATHQAGGDRHLGEGDSDLAGAGDRCHRRTLLPQCRDPGLRHHRHPDAGR